jgi:hypothetical protein
MEAQQGLNGGWLRRVRGAKGTFEMFDRQND